MRERERVKSNFINIKLWGLQDNAKIEAVYRKKKSRGMSPIYVDRGNILLKSSANVSFESYFPFIKFTYISGFIFRTTMVVGEGKENKLNRICG